MEDIIKINTIGDLKTVLYKNIIDEEKMVYFYSNNMDVELSSISVNDGNVNMITKKYPSSCNFKYSIGFIVDNFIRILNSSSVLLDGNEITIKITDNKIILMPTEMANVLSGGKECKSINVDDDDKEKNVSTTDMDIFKRIDSEVNIMSAKDALINIAIHGLNSISNLINDGDHIIIHLENYTLDEGFRLSDNIYYSHNDYFIDYLTQYKKYDILYIREDNSTESADIYIYISWANSTGNFYRCNDEREVIKEVDKSEFYNDITKL